MMNYWKLKVRIQLNTKTCWNIVQKFWNTKGCVCSTKLHCSRKKQRNYHRPLAFNSNTKKHTNMRPVQQEETKEEARIWWGTGSPSCLEAVRILRLPLTWQSNPRQLQPTFTLSRSTCQEYFSPSSQQTTLSFDCVWSNTPCDHVYLFCSVLNTKSQNKIVVNQNWVFYIDFFMIVRVNRRKIYLIQEEDNILLQFSSEKVI